MYSVIQCLSNTRPLLEYLLGDCHLSDINTTVSSMKGALIKGTVYSQLYPDSMVSFYVVCSMLHFFSLRFVTVGHSLGSYQYLIKYGN
jgi:ubiquitin carboxyl-terminal hydrolase 2/21